LPDIIFENAIFEKSQRSVFNAWFYANAVSLFTLSWTATCSDLFDGGLSCLLLAVLPSSFGYADLQSGSTAE